MFPKLRQSMSEILSRLFQHDLTSLSHFAIINVVKGLQRSALVASLIAYSNGAFNF